MFLSIGHLFDSTAQKDMPVTFLITTAKYEKVRKRTTCQLSHLGPNSCPFHMYYLEFKILSKRKLTKSAAASAFGEKKLHVLFSV